MKAVALRQYLPATDPNSLLDVEVPAPRPGPRDLLVRVRAVSVNPVDVKLRSPKPKVEAAPRVLGWDAAGIVESIGADVKLFAPGDTVFYAGDITRSGTNQELHCVDERLVGKKPETLSFAEAAALPLTAITAYETLFERLQLDPSGAQPNQKLLILGGAGGVGSIAIQLAKLARAQVIATASRSASRAWAEALGADVVIDHTQNLREQLDALGIGEVDAVAIFNDTERYIAALPDLVRPFGRIASIVETSRPVDIEPLKKKSLSFSWELMFTRSLCRTPDMIEQHRMLNWVAERIDMGTLKTTLSKTLSPISAETIRQAHVLLESGRTIGKVVVSGWPESS